MTNEFSSLIHHKTPLMTFLWPYVTNLFHHLCAILYQYRLSLAWSVPKPAKVGHSFEDSRNIQPNDQLQKIQSKEATSKDKNRVCYTCRSKGHFSKECPNGNSLKSNLVHYNFSNLKKDKIGTCAVKVIKSPHTRIRAIWVPKHLVTNLKGPNKVWVPKIA